MYLRILKKDLQRKKTMNVILLIFIILAATFIAGSVNNMVSVMTALDSFFAKAEVPDYWFSTMVKEEAGRFADFAEENNYIFRLQELLLIDPNDVKVGSEKLEYSNNICMSQLKNGIRIFDSEDKELTEIRDGEIYMTAENLNSPKSNFKIGDTIEISANGKTKFFTIKGAVKDAMFGSPMIGMTHFLVSENDCEYFAAEDAKRYYSVCIYTQEQGFEEQLEELSLNMVFNESSDVIKNMYLMDMVVAAVMLVVSVCLILISMVILRFTIQFTMSEEFREIGVMKAIGIRNTTIRGLYITKYFAVSSVGGIIGFIFSIPFGKMMIGNLSENIILSGEANYFLNMICAVSTVAVVVMFCYFCTGKVKSFSPIDAIRNGENGERYSRKGFIWLNRFHLSPVLFLALNDILSEIRRFAAMIVIFTLGMLLVIIPVNTINTLQSDKLITWFNMAECDHVIDKNTIFNECSNNREMVEAVLKDIRKKLLQEGVKADVFEEVIFKMNISYNGKKTSSLAFQGVGDIAADAYVYLEGTAPQNCDEAAISHVVADHIGADIGDIVEIKNGEAAKLYMVTAIYQTMNNMGEGIRFFEEEQIDYTHAMGSFGIQIRYADSPKEEELSERKELLTELFPGDSVYTPGEYVNDMIGDIAGQLQGMKHLILTVVLCINILVTVLMVKSFLIKEKGEIAMLKAIGFPNTSLITWQTLRIGLVLFFSVLLGAAVGTPLSELSVGPIFQLMGAQRIEFEIVPLEVYVIYPVIVLGVTVCAGMVAALQVRKIAASETSNIE